MFNRADLIKFIAGAFALLLLIVALVFVMRSIYKTGYTAGHDAVEKAWNQQNAELQARNQALTVQVATLQRTLDTQALNFERKGHEDRQAIIDDYEHRMAAVTSRVERVYIPAKCPVPANNAARAATANAPAGHGQTRAELDPETVVDLASIARDGDTCIVQLNEMIDHYQAAQAALEQLQQSP